MPSSRTWQFGVGTLLVLCLAGFGAGYRWGGSARDRHMAAAQVNVVSYDVSSLLQKPGSDGAPTPSVQSQLEQLRELIQATVAPETWMQPERTIACYPAESSLIIRQTGACHDQITQLLQGLRVHTTTK